MSATIQRGVRVEPTRKHVPSAPRGRGRPLPAWVPVPDGAGPAEHWRVGTGLALGPTDGAASTARSMAAAELRLWGLRAAVDAVTLPLSELVANAATAAAGKSPPVRVWLRPRLDMAAVLVTVWDAGPGVPVLRPGVPAPDPGGLASPDGEGLAWVDSLDLDALEQGRFGGGLHVVSREAAGWGYQGWIAPPGVPGKTCWCVVMTPAGPRRRQGYGGVLSLLPTRLNGESGGARAA